MGKKLTLTNVEMLNIFRGSQLIQNSMDLIVPLDFKFTKVVNTLKPHVDEYQEKINKLKDKYAEKEEDGSFKIIKEEGKNDKLSFETKEKEKKFHEDIDQLDQSEMEIHLPVIFKISDFVDENGKPLKINKGLSYMISEIVEM